MRGDGASEVEEYGVNSFVYKARRPFHPKRFFDRLHGDWTGVLRSKGFFWLASRLDKVGIWSQAGRMARLEAGGYWWASVPKEQWPNDPLFEKAISKHWHPEVGDCRQELVFIGINMDELSIYDSLQDCLLTDDEMSRGPGSWSYFPDPFPSWNASQH